MRVAVGGGFGTVRGPLTGAGFAKSCFLPNWAVVVPKHVEWAIGVCRTGDIPRRRATYHQPTVLGRTAAPRPYRIDVRRREPVLRAAQPVCIIFKACGQ